MEATTIQTVFTSVNDFKEFRFYFSTIGVFYAPERQIEELMFNISTGYAIIDFVETIDGMLYRTQATFENFFPKTIHKTFMF